MWRSGSTNLPSGVFFCFLLEKFKKKKEIEFALYLFLWGGLKWNEMTMILRALHFVRFLSISLALFLFSSAPERITKGKRIFREGFRDLRTDRDSYLPPISLSLLSLSLSLPGPFFFLCVISLPFSGKKRSFFLLLPTRICRCRRHQKGLAVSSKSDR